MSAQPGYSLLQLALDFLKLGSIGFGGPVALVGLFLFPTMHTGS